MKCFAKWREFCNNAKFARWIQKFYSSGIYPMIICGLAFLAYYKGWELYVAAGMLLLCAIGLWICRDVRAGIPVLLSFIFIVPLEHISSPDNQYLTHTNPLEDYYSQHMPFLYGLIAFVVIMIMVRFLLWGGFWQIFYKPTKLALFILPLTIGLALNGLRSENWQWLDLGFGLLTAFCWIFLYLLFVHNLSFDKDLVRFFCKSCFWIAMLLIAEELYVFKINEVIVDGVVYKYKFDLGWGAQNAFGAITSLLIPPIFYLARESKISLFYYLGGLATYAATMLCMSRAAMLLGTIVFVVSLVSLCISGKRKYLYCIVNTLLIVAATVLFLIHSEKILRYFEFVNSFGFDDNGRYDLWGIMKNEDGHFIWSGSGAWQVFQENKIFGYGFWECAYKAHETIGIPAFTPFPAMFHNTIFEMLAATGLVGTIAYGLYRLRTLQMMAWRMTAARFFLGLMILALLGTSLLDNHLFYIYDAFFYSVGLAVIELDYKNSLQQAKQKRLLKRELKLAQKTK